MPKDGRARAASQRLTCPTAPIAAAVARHVVRALRRAICWAFAVRYIAFACDYDGTIAADGLVDQSTLKRLQQLRESGRRLVLVTGRDLPDLLRVFPHLDVFDRVVAENGGLLYYPDTRAETALGPLPPPGFVDTLRGRGVTPLSVGRVIVATWEPHQAVVLETIRELGLELQVIFNKGAVMVLPSGMNKASGLSSALDSLHLSPHNCVGIGDAENDHAFLSLCECSVAVANALPAVKATATLVTSAPHGGGVSELVDRLLATDLHELDNRMSTRHLPLGTLPDGAQLLISPWTGAVLIAGRSGSGKSTVTAGLLERLTQRKYQFCLVDPEGDYSDAEFAITVRGAAISTLVDEALDVLARPAENVAVNLLDIALEDRSEAVERLLARVVELRARTARPHWIVLDEAHHALPAAWARTDLTVATRPGLALITVHPEQVARSALSELDLAIAVGPAPHATLASVATVLGIGAPADIAQGTPGTAVAWWPGSGGMPVRFEVMPPDTQLQRHRRKYALGELGEDKSFYFTGTDGRLKLRAQNLMLFLQTADGVDDETWSFHLCRGDYSRWIRLAIKDSDLADEIEALEESALSADESRKRVRAAVSARYTAP
jgi:hydroxymethylpyrimidine pyrophosphatase-like HAD family hydrolase